MTAKVKMSEEYVESDEEGLEEVNEEVPEVEQEEFPEVEDLDPSAEIWEGGPNAGQIMTWKEKYGDVFVSSFTPDDHIVWRTMNRFEYRNHVKQMEQMAQTGQVTTAEAGLINEEAMCQICVLYPSITPEFLATCEAGVPSSLANDILEASGFVALEVRKL